MSEALSTREMEVPGHLAEGKTLQAVALELGLSFGTVGTSLSSAFRPSDPRVRHKG